MIDAKNTLYCKADFTAQNENMNNPKFRCNFRGGGGGGNKQLADRLTLSLFTRRENERQRIPW